MDTTRLVTPSFTASSSAAAWASGPASFLPSCSHRQGQGRNGGRGGTPGAVERRAAVVGGSCMPAPTPRSVPHPAQAHPAQRLQTNTLAPAHLEHALRGAVQVKAALPQLLPPLVALHQALGAFSGGRGGGGPGGARVRPEAGVRQWVVCRKGRQAGQAGSCAGSGTAAGAAEGAQCGSQARRTRAGPTGWLALAS